MIAHMINEQNSGQTTPTVDLRYEAEKDNDVVVTIRKAIASEFEIRKDESKPLMRGPTQQLIELVLTVVGGVGTNLLYDLLKAKMQSITDRLRKDSSLKQKMRLRLKAEDYEIDVIVHDNKALTVVESRKENGEWVQGPEQYPYGKPADNSDTYDKELKEYHALLHNALIEKKFEAISRLYSNNLRTVIKLTRRYENRGASHDELVAAGFQALCDFTVKFASKESVNLKDYSTFATMAIRGAMTKIITPKEDSKA